MLKQSFRKRNDKTVLFTIIKVLLAFALQDYKTAPEHSDNHLDACYIFYEHTNKCKCKRKTTHMQTHSLNKYMHKKRKKKKLEY